MSIHQRDKDQRKAACAIALKSLAKKLGRTPSEKEYKQHYQSIPEAPTPSQLRYDFGTWTAAVIGAGLPPLSTAPPRYEIANDDLKAEFVRIANKLGRMPSLEVFRKEGKFSNVPYKTRWGKWSQVQSHFATNYAHEFTFEPVIRTTVDSPTARKKLSLECPLVFEPVNEFETIALFTLLASDLGYRIHSIRAEFPDAILEKGGAKISAEFEFLTSNYLLHCHPKSSDILCVCWRIDSDLSPLNVLCLEDVLLDRRVAQTLL